MPQPPPDLTDVRAVALTTCPLLAEHLHQLHPAVRTCLLTRLAGLGTLPDTDALLLLTRHDPHSPAAAPAGNGLVTTTVYIGTDLDDAGIWARATKLRAGQVYVLPDQDAQLADELNWHFDSPPAAS
jgi:hypothetical protein